MFDFWICAIYDWYMFLPDNSLVSYECTVRTFRKFCACYPNRTEKSSTSPGFQNFLGSRCTWLIHSKSQHTVFYRFHTVNGIILFFSYYTVFSRLDSCTTSVVLKDTIDPYEDFVKMEVAVYGTCDYWTFRRGWKRIRSKHWAKTGISIYRLWLIQRDGKLQIRTLPERIGFVYYLITEELESSLSLQWTLSRIPMITSWFMTSVSQNKR